ncbi:MAG TPA: MFS transporter [Dehalococcoidia bacterium]|nr:MFS transporter [Dehalococcoidia bacterium]
MPWLSACFCCPWAVWETWLAENRSTSGGLVIFVLAAALAGTSPSLNLLIGAKVLQGVGSAMIQGNGMATIISVFSGEERGKALVFHLSVVGTGAIAGPALGGILVSALGWRSVFFVNVPIGFITIAVSLLVLAGGTANRSPRESSSLDRPSFDWGGALLSAFALLALLLVVGNLNRMGWDSPAILIGALTGVSSLGVFIWWELRSAAPMLDLRLFRRKLVALGIAAGWIAFLGTSAARFMMPFYLQRVLEYSPRDIGLLMIPPALCMVIVGPVTGQLSDRFGWRPFTFSGLALSAVAWFVLATRLK